MRKLKAEGRLTGAPLALMQPFPDEMLFDTKGDPHEINNLAKSDRPEHRAALIRMRAAMDTWMVETGDRGHIPEPADVVAPFVIEMHEWFGTPDWAEQP
jgi:hypothetical protein